MRKDYSKAPAKCPSKGTWSGASKTQSTMGKTPPKAKITTQSGAGFKKK